MCYAGRNSAGIFSQKKIPAANNSSILKIEQKKYLRLRKKKWAFADERHERFGKIKRKEAAGRAKRI